MYLNPIRGYPWVNPGNLVIFSHQNRGTMAKKISIKRYAGVYYTESTVKISGTGRPIFWVELQRFYTGRLAGSDAAGPAGAGLQKQHKKSDMRLLEQDRTEPISQKSSEKPTNSLLVN